MDYGFEHEGKVYTPNGTPGIDPTENAERNKQIELGQLTYWDSRPPIMLAYYKLAADKQWDLYGTVSTWLGTTIGTITKARLYRHNFGGQFVALTVKGTNGAIYHGRASYDWGQCVTLRRAKDRS